MWRLPHRESGLDGDDMRIYEDDLESILMLEGTHNRVFLLVLGGDPWSRLRKQQQKQTCKHCVLLIIRQGSCQYCQCIPKLFQRDRPTSRKCVMMDTGSGDCGQLLFMLSLWVAGLWVCLSLLSVGFWDGGFAWPEVRES